MSKTAIILGGGANVWREFEALKIPNADIIAINDAGYHYSGKLALWVTLHPQKMPMWKRQRAEKGFDMSFKSIGFGKPSKEAPKFTDEIADCWRGQAKASGSSGLFACQVALAHGYEKIILCGVPMDGNKNVFRGKDWKDFNVYRQTWLDNLFRIEEKVVSQGGWTAELLGTYDNPKSRKKRAIVLGGARSVWSDFDSLAELRDTADIIACNLAGYHFPDPIKLWVSLHPTMFPEWITERKKAGYDMNFKTIGFTRDFKPMLGVDELRGAWGSSQGKASGSSGLFAVEIALEKGYEEIILCGCPLDKVPNLFNGHHWSEYANYRQAWIDNYSQITGKVFSQSGWTKKLLGSYFVNMPEN